jgi:hypothetical protein
MRALPMVRSCQAEPGAAREQEWLAWVAPPVQQAPASGVQPETALPGHPVGRRVRLRAPGKVAALFRRCSSPWVRAEPERGWRLAYCGRTIPRQPALPSGARRTANPALCRGRKRCGKKRSSGRKRSRATLRGKDATPVVYHSRKSQPERGALAGLAHEVDRAAVHLDHAKGGGQTDSGATGLGREI